MLAPARPPFLFRFKSGDTVHHIFGTTVMPDPRVIRFAPSVEAARKGSDALCLGVAPVGQPTQAMMMSLMLPVPTTLREYVGPKVAGDFEKWCNERGMQMAQLDRVKPWVVRAQVALGDKLQLASSQSQEAVLTQAAKADKQVLFGLETFQQQVQAMDALPKDVHVGMLQEALRNHFRDEDPHEAIIQAYLTGDSKQVVKVRKARALTPELDQEVHRLLTLSRSTRFADGIAKVIREKPERSCFFALGAGQLQGKGGVIELLRHKGFKVERLSASGEVIPDDAPQPASAPQNGGASAGQSRDR